LLTGPLLLIQLLQGRAELLVVPLDGIEGLIRKPSGNELWRSPQQAVPNSNVVVQEGEGLPWFQGFEPETHAAQLGGHGIHVHPVEASADHISQRMLVQER